MKPNPYVGLSIEEKPRLTRRAVERDQKQRRRLRAQGITAPGDVSVTLVTADEIDICRVPRAR